jgi:hypothetical protein
MRWGDKKKKCLLGLIPLREKKEGVRGFLNHGLNAAAMKNAIPIPLLNSTPFRRRPFTKHSLSGLAS